MSNKVADAIKSGSEDCDRVCPEFSGPVFDNLQFLNWEYGFKQPVFKHIGRECWVVFNKEVVEIKIGYEPYSLPWGYVTRSNKGTVSLNELMDQYGFELVDNKYREYDEVRKKLFAIESARAADEYAESSKEQLHRAITEWVKDLTSFLRAHLTDILS